ncbi:4Fe-4S ferredoxin [Candidatus Thorarchaeota archaeon]|nr:MAG: 4Fe-4S ferredoxin [Candidatus Thorarchaeota archaeon]
MSTARKPITPKPRRTRQKVLVILQEQCKQCELCITFCPKNVLCFDMSKYNKKGYHPVTACDIDACVNCGFCERICPDMAIFLADKEEAQRAIDDGALEENTLIPELMEQEEEEED